MNLFYTTVTDPSYNEVFVGVFSTVAKAQEACQHWATEWWYKEPPLKWTGSAGFYKAIARKVTFEINKIGMDEVQESPGIVT